MPDSTGLPGYATMLAAYHHAFEAELRRMIADVWPPGARRVLDLACGDGSYSAWLVAQGGPETEVCAVDLSKTWLDLAQDKAEHAGTAEQVRAVAASALSLPFRDNSFDFVWCAQSLYSLPEIIAVLAELRRVLRPGGTIAVLENDTLHQVLLPWPAELELRVRSAELAAIRHQADDPQKFYIGRELRRTLLRADFLDCRKRTYATNRVGPFSSEERTFFLEYLRALRSSVAPHLPADELAELDRLIAGPDSFLDDAEITVTCLDHVVWGFKAQ
jgi:ubiquinone/menaquinone biosynthesis C-methylase UbiE